MNSDKKTIVYVDDENINLELFRLNFAREYNILTFPSAHEAIENVNFDTIDLLLTDFKMPVMNGMEFIKKIKAQNPHLKCIMISGFTEVDILSGSDRLLLSNFVSKPWKRAILSEIISTSLQS